ncbi:hypothetical protein K0M31_001345 [Melipona bicolor]|uniref:Uncharacterized protein n=1 Tax=Melipona bicolor TaxID=60889 RepID=A0AA40GG74_9HYME|nr:hypothetical protein K0M31_001345 [Melipona bicolor]
MMHDCIEPPEREETLDCFPSRLISNRIRKDFLSREGKEEREREKEKLVGADSVKVERWRGLQLDGERKFCKGGTDGGGGRAKGKTTTKRHSWMPSKTWPLLVGTRKPLPEPSQAQIRCI